MLNSASSTKSQNRKSSRPNSTSSSSTVTIKCAPSLSSRSGSRTPHLKVRPPSPEHIEVYLASLTYSTPEQGQVLQKTVSCEQIDPGTCEKEGVGNFNRWSHSTSPSINSIQDNAHGRCQQPTNGGRLSIGTSPPSNSSKPPVVDHGSPVKYGPVKSRYSPGKEDSQSSLQRPVGGMSRPSSGTSQIPQRHSDDPDTPSSAWATPLTSDLPTASNVATITSDYFGDRWKNRSSSTSQKPVLDVVRQRVKKGTPKNSKRIPSISSPQPASSSLNDPVATDISRSFEARSPARLASHTRNLGQSAQGSGDLEMESSIACPKSDDDLNRKVKDRTQRTVLSRALAKANTAVLLDNAHNLEGAIEAYTDACLLLHQVMHRSSAGEDRKKLETIRTTYTDRIKELQLLHKAQQSAMEKALPTRPMSDDSLGPNSGIEFEDDTPVIETATATRFGDSAYMLSPEEVRLSAEHDILDYRQSLPPPGLDKVGASRSSLAVKGSSRQKPSTASSRQEKQYRLCRLGRRMEPQYTPLPLSPRRPPTSSLESQEKTINQLSSNLVFLQDTQHSLDTGTDSTSWLDTIDESGGSSASSIHSRLSSFGLNLRHGYRNANEIEADLDAAMNAAVDAAYEEDSDIGGNVGPKDAMKENQRNTKFAVERIPKLESEVEADRGSICAQAFFGHSDDENSIHPGYSCDEAEEEERLLEEMTNGYIIDDFRFDTSSMSAIPRQSDSSGFSGRTYGSSTGSSNVVTRTSLATLAQSGPATSKQKPPPPPPHPPPVTALPTPPVPVTAPPLPSAPSISPPQPPFSRRSSHGSRPTSLISSAGLGVRDRRLSGQNAKQLTVETNPRLSTGPQAPKPKTPSEAPVTTHIPSLSEEVALKDTFQDSISTANSWSQGLPPLPLTPLASIHSSDSIQGDSPTTSELTAVGSHERNDGAAPVPPSPDRILEKTMPPSSMLRKNMSSSSLVMHKLIVPSSQVADISPVTPGSATLPIRVGSRGGIMATTPTWPTSATSNHNAEGPSAGGMCLFEDHIRTPTSPGTPVSRGPNAPLPLEPCPESFLLRPFWSMRCLYQTVAHPRGGYISNKLFIPRDVWRVKNVKIKAIDDKVAQCDLLTAALEKLAKVDNLDADAVLEEMQSFETVLDQVRLALQRKLGSEVGVHSSAALFKTSPATEEAASLSEVLSARSTTAPAKSYMAASWRKLRSKSSGTPLNAAPSSKNGSKDGLSLSSLPMTSNTSTMTPKTNVQQVKTEGPHAHYMGALARLFDAVQVIDSIARQVEDPGLKCSSKTHVGLELCTRNAAEFFAFYICRFAFADVGLMLDKFIKRGSEWVLA